MNTTAVTTAVTFATITDVEATATETLTRVLFTFAGRRYELTRYRAGRVELYEQDPGDGIMMWAGYVDYVTPYLPGAAARAVEEGLAALTAAHAARWEGYLPGADRWIHAA